MTRLNYTTNCRKGAQKENGHGVNDVFYDVSVHDKTEKHIHESLSPELKADERLRDAFQKTKVLSFSGTN